MKNTSNLNVIDVICPVYNHQKYIRDCLESVFGQEDVFVIAHVIDDASTDDSLQLIKEFQNKYPHQLRLYSNTRNQGNAVKSLGVNDIKFEGDFWTYIEGDDFLVNKKKFIKQINLLKMNEYLLATATQCDLWNTELNSHVIIRPDLKRWNFYDLVTKKHRFKLYCHISSFVWRNEIGRKSENLFQVCLSDLKKTKSQSEVLLVHLLLKKSGKHVEFQDIEGSCYRYTRVGIWSSLDSTSQKLLNDLLQLEIDSITPNWIKIKQMMVRKVIQNHFLSKRHN